MEDFIECVLNADERTVVSAKRAVRDILMGKEPRVEDECILFYVSLILGEIRELLDNADPITLRLELALLLDGLPRGCIPRKDVEVCFYDGCVAFNACELNTDDLDPAEAVHVLSSTLKRHGFPGEYIELLEELEKVLRDGG